MLLEQSSLGSYLREEREKRGFTVEQVAAATRIGVKILHFLEGDRFIDLPAVPFVRGFIVSYCRFIGLDSHLVLEHFKDFIESKSKDRPNRDGGHSGYVFEKRIGEHRSRAVLVIAMVIFVSLGGFGILLWKPTLKHRKVSHLAQLQQLPAVTVPVEQLVVPVQAVSMPVRVEPVGVLPQVLNVDPLDSGRNLSSREVRYRIIFKVFADVWVRYQVDQRPVRHFVMRQGKVLVLKAAQKIVVEFSRPDWVRLIAHGVESNVVKELVSESRFLVPVGKSHILVFQSQSSKNIQNPFDSASAIEKAPLPVPVISSTEAIE